MSQNDEILYDLKRGMKITPEDAKDNYCCNRLSARIMDLRQRGYDIRTTMVSGVNRRGKPVRFAEYFLHRSAEQ